MQEQAKYEAMWANPAYRHWSPGEEEVKLFLAAADPQVGQTVRDLGCGSGRPGALLARAGLVVTQYDFAANCRDPDIDLPFVQHDLNQPIEGIADLAYCADVMEHLPPEQAVNVLRNVVGAAWRVYLQICTRPDDFGTQAGHPLHLTVKAPEWWRERLEELECRILWSDEDGSWCSFLVSAYADAKEFPAKTVLNVTDDQVVENIRANLEAGYTEVEPHLETDTPLMILAGGPSLNEHKDEIIRRRKACEFLVTEQHAPDLPRVGNRALDSGDVRWPRVQ